MKLRQQHRTRSPLAKDPIVLAMALDELLERSVASEEPLQDLWGQIRDKYEPVADPKRSGYHREPEEG